MSEKGGPVIMVVLLCVLFWLCSEPAKDPTQCDLLDSAPLIEQVATVKESFTVQPNHIVDANKKADPMPSPSDKHEKTKREILIFVSANCPPCEKWKRCEMQRFMDAGWSVGIVEVHSYGLTPTFEIESGDKKATIKGYTTLEQAAEALR
jgi:protein-disulfide isomerase